MKRSLLLFVLVNLSVTLMAQHPDSMKSDASLKNTRWKLVALAGFDSLPVLKKDAWIQFTLQENRFRGQAGCNNMTGTYTLGKEQRLKVGPIAMTRMACPEPMMQVENGLVSAISNFDEYKINGDTLTLLKENKVLARFEALYLK